MCTACTWADWQGARFGDNMRDVSVIEDDKIEAELKFCYSINLHGIDDLKIEIEQINESDIDEFCQEYEQQYRILDELEKRKKNQLLREAAKIQLGL
ncbi:unnamed protein product [Rotaria sp. Silwood2]|nr:unnamed protein product [Rotaria sp. Silwood2]